LRLEVARVLASALGDGGVEYDENGDIPFRFGSTNLCVRTHNEVPVVRTFARLISDLSVSHALLETLNELNNVMTFAKVFWDGDAVVLSMDVPANPFVDSHLVNAIVVLGRQADELDDELQKRFGGRTVYGAYEPQPHKAPAGYL
jgi:hypothetical protein